MNYRNDIKEFKEWTLTKTIAYNFALAVFFTLVLAVVIINALSLRLDVVLSDSMAPVFTKRDVVVIMKQDNYQIGDIIEFQGANGYLVTHEVVAYDEASKLFTTKGRGNSDADQTQVTYGQINGKVIALWTNGRIVYNTIKNNYFILISILVGAWVLSTTISGEMEIKKHNILNV